MDFKRMVPPLVLVCLGTGMLVYGAMFHTATVFDEVESELSIPVPAPFAATTPFTGEQAIDPFDQGFHDPGGDPFGATDPFGSGATDPFGSGIPADEPVMGEGIDSFEQGGAAPGEAEENLFTAPTEQHGDLPSEQPWLPDSSGMMFQKVTRIDLIASDEREWVLIREVTFGGVARLENGELKRTYSGKPPALCPT